MPLLARRPSGMRWPRQAVQAGEPAGSEGSRSQSRPPWTPCAPSPSCSNPPPLVPLALAALQHRPPAGPPPAAPPQAAHHRPDRPHHRLALRPPRRPRRSRRPGESALFTAGTVLVCGGGSRVRPASPEPARDRGTRGLRFSPLGTPHLGQCPSSVLVYYVLSGESSGWVGFGSSTSKAGSPSSSAACWR
jgi:hypothetical protein